MSSTLQLMQKINWFLKPIKNIVLFFFTTKLGIFLLLLSLIAYILISAYFNLKYKKLLYQAAGLKTSFSPLNIAIAIGTQFGKLILWIFNNLAVLLVVLLLLAGTVGLSSAFDSINNFVQNQRKISQLRTVIKNLSQDYEVAKIKILKVNPYTNQTTFTIAYYDYAKNKYLPYKQTITIKGHQIYVLSLIINFDYSQIETGKKINLAIPYKVFSEVIPSAKGIKLNVFDSLGVPIFYHRNSEQIYGIDSSDYAARLKEIAKLIHNPKYAREQGVRSILAASPHNITYPRPGQVYKIFIEQTGGLILKRSEKF